MKKLQLILMVIGIFSISLLAQDSVNSNTQMNNNRTSKTLKSNKKNEFAKEAASGGMMEVKLGRLAQQNASSQDVKDFGQRMISDHSKANEQLKEIAQKNNITLPNSMMSKHQKKYDKLKQYSGKEFDKKYMDAMVKDHKEDIENFKKASKNADNEEVREWAKKTVPKLQEHLRLAEQTQKNVEGK